MARDFKANRRGRSRVIRIAEWPHCYGYSAVIGEITRATLQPSGDSMAERDALDQTNGTDRALERKWW